jgi:dTDP-4-amino-4,6-dideoxygalactose transaminase
MGGDERALLLEAFDSNWIAPLGPSVDAFEAQLAEVTGGHVAALNSGTSALHLALVLLGVEAGDEVLVSDLTFSAPANAVRYVGGVPVFVDCDRHTWNMDPDLLADFLRSRARAGRLPKAAIVVDLYGQCADYDAILPVCREFGVAVIEDAAEALGSTYRGRPAGSLSEIGVFSFNGNKIITTSGGGALITGEKETAERARNLASQAREAVSHYEHRVVGYNYRLSNLLAAVGCGQLGVLKHRVARRREINSSYRTALGDLPGIDFMPIASYGKPNCWLTTLTVNPELFGASREEIRVALEASNIEARPLWKPMHMQPVFQGATVVGGAVGEELFNQGLCLPSGTAMTQQDLDRVVACVSDTGQRLA